MRFYGKVYKDGKFWLAELPLLDAMTQGHTRKEAYAMVEDLLESLANRPDFKVTVHPGKQGDFEVSSTDPRVLISLFLRRQRERSGLSLSEAAKRLAAKAVAGEIHLRDIDSDVMGRELCVADLPEPDLFIRTGGEQRISNFLLWQLAYTELYFTDLLWPDFDAAAFQTALQSFAGRQRRFGQTGDQVERSRRA